MTDHIETNENGVRIEATSECEALIGLDKDALTTALQRLYELEAAYLDDRGPDGIPEWIPVVRQFLERALGKIEVYDHE